MVGAASSGGMRLVRHRIPRHALAVNAPCQDGGAKKVVAAKPERRLSSNAEEALCTSISRVDGPLLFRHLVRIDHID